MSTGPPVRIRSVEAHEITNPLALAPAEIQTAAGEAGGSPHPEWASFIGQAPGLTPSWPDVVCVVTATDGTWGMGMTGFAGPVVPIINGHLAGVARDQPLDDLVALYDLLRLACASHYGSSGAASYAISAIDLAVWDLVGKLSGEPVHELLGGRRVDSLAGYATGLAVDQYLDLGFTAVKILCPGGADWTDTLAVIAEQSISARELIGPDAPLMVDGWGLLDIDKAEAVANACEAAGLHWLEDAVDPERIAQSFALRSRLPELRIAAGERWSTVDTFSAHLEAGLVDVVQPDVLWVGGVTSTRRIAAMAEAAGVGLSLHCGGSDPWSQHLAVSLAGQGLTEVFFGGAPIGGHSTYRAVAGVARAVGGRVTANEGPGFGIELTLADIARATG